MEVVIKGGEFGLIKRIREEIGTKQLQAGNQGNRTNGIILGIGDDAAILQPPEGKLLASIDMLVEGIHLEKSYNFAGCHDYQD